MATGLAKMTAASLVGGEQSLDSVLVDGIDERAWVLHEHHPSPGPSELEPLLVDDGLVRRDPVVLGEGDEVQP